MTEPTNAEVMRRLDEVSRQLLQLARDMRDDRNAAADTYVRKDVYTPLHEALGRRVGDLERENEERDRGQDAFRRQMTIAVISAALPSLLALIIILARITGGTPT